MATIQNQYSPLSAAPGMGSQRADTVDWSQEISPIRPAAPAAAPAQRPTGGTVSTVANPQLDMKNNLPTEVIDAPTTAEALKSVSGCLYVLKDGRVVARNGKLE